MSEHFHNPVETPSNGTIGSVHYFSGSLSAKNVIFLAFFLKFMLINDNDHKVVEFLISLFFIREIFKRKKKPKISLQNHIFS